MERTPPQSPRSRSPARRSPASPSRAGPTDIFIDMPEDTIISIAHTLSVADIGRFCRASKRFNQVICKSDRYWEARLEKQNPIIAEKLKKRALNLVEDVSFAKPKIQELKAIKERRAINRLGYKEEPEYKKIQEEINKIKEKLKELEYIKETDDEKIDKIADKRQILRNKLNDRLIQRKKIQADYKNQVNEKLAKIASIELSAKSALFKRKPRYYPLMTETAEDEDIYPIDEISYGDLLKIIRKEFPKKKFNFKAGDLLGVMDPNDPDYTKFYYFYKSKKGDLAVSISELSETDPNRYPEKLLEKYPPDVIRQIYGLKKLFPSISK